MAAAARNHLRAQVFTVPKGVSDLDEWTNERFDNEFEALNDIAREELDFSLMRRGDVVVFDDIAGYRNDGKLIFDGFNLVPLDFEPDEYGNVPSQFSITDFPSTQYWSEAITHNTTVWIDPKKMNAGDHRVDEIDKQFMNYGSELGDVFAVVVSGYTIYTSSVENTLAKLNGDKPFHLEYSDTLELLGEPGEDFLYDDIELRKVFDP